ncbi:MAG: DNA polymerase III subunit delta' [Cellvibrionaceae bacterium]
MAAVSFIPYPWQQPHWQNFLQQVDQERMPHALLLSGQKGIGKWHYAHSMANYLLCMTPKSGLACNQCRSCQLNASTTHPDKSVVMPEDVGKQIKIDQIRQLSNTIATTAQQGGRKVVILGPIEQLNINAANALLKNLEEPAADTFFILVSHVISGVMATIRSRCQILSFPVPEKNLAMSWLKEVGVTGDTSLILGMSAGAPLTAKALLDNNTSDQLSCFYDGLLKAQQSTPLVDITIAKDWLDLELHDTLEWWLQLVSRTLKKSFQLSDSSPSNLIEADLSFLQTMIEIESLAVKFNRQWLFKFTDKLIQSKNQLLHGANPNKQLLLEELLMDWYAILKTAKS